MNDENYYAWLIESRSKSQSLLLDLYAFLTDKQSRLENEDFERSVFGLLVGAAFSLWRAVFLVGADRKWTSVLEKAKDFLEIVIEDNAINYPQDKKTRSWTVGYYLNNARYRVARVSRKYAAHDIYRHLPSMTQLEALEDIHESGGIDDRAAIEVWNRLYDAVRAAFDMLRRTDVPRT